MFVICVFWGRSRLFSFYRFHMLLILHGFVHAFEVGFCKSFKFSIGDIDLTLGLLAFRRHVVWRDSVGVEFYVMA